MKKGDWILAEGKYAGVASHVGNEIAVLKMESDVMVEFYVKDCLVITEEKAKCFFELVKRGFFKLK